MSSALGNEAWVPALIASLIVPQQSAESTSTQSLGMEHVRSIRSSSCILHTAGSVLASVVDCAPPQPASKPRTVAIRRLIGRAYQDGNEGGYGAGARAARFPPARYRPTAAHRR